MGVDRASADDASERGAVVRGGADIRVHAGGMVASSLSEKES